MVTQLPQTEKIIMAVATPNYEPVAVRERQEAEHGQAGHRTDWIRVGLVALVLFAVWSGAVPRIHGRDWLALAGLAIGGVSDLQRSYFRPA